MVKRQEQKAHITMTHKPEPYKANIENMFQLV
jgi:hypothetical protein